MIFCSESVSEGHPDKICDQISDSILDACLKKDPNSRVACEVLACNEKILVAGEITTKAKIDYKKIVLETLSNIDYKNDKNVNLKKIKIEIFLQTQSPEIANTVNTSFNEKKSIGAGDQGQMFGYACDYFNKYCHDFMPIAYTIAHLLIINATKLRKSGDFKYALPDMKSQAILEFHNKDYRNPKIKKLLMSIQHDKKYDKKTFEKYIITKIMIPTAKSLNLNTNFEIVINPSGSFHNGGWMYDTGLTGRKIIVDTYGGWSTHGGGCFSGKDPSKVDRTGAYFARYIAKNLVAAKLCRECEVQISYTIGSAYPLDFNVKTFRTGILNDNILKDIISHEFNWSLSKIIQKFNMTSINYYHLSKNGHFGHIASEYPWEKLDKVDDLLKYRIKPIIKNKNVNLI